MVINLTKILTEWIKCQMSDRDVYKKSTGAIRPHKWLSKSPPKCLSIKPITRKFFSVKIWGKRAKKSF